MEDNAQEPSYIDYEAFLDPNFSPTSFSNSLVHATNNASDTFLDLDTPLSRVLFDVQDIDKRIDQLTSRSALPLLTHTKQHVQAGSSILNELETQLSTLTDSYQRLHQDVVVRHELAQEARLAAERLWKTVKLGRSVGRCLTLGRQLEVQLGEASSESAGLGARREDYGAMVRTAHTILSLRQIFSTAGPQGEAEGLDRITVVRTLRSEMVEPTEERTIARAEQIVGQFSMSALAASSSSQSSTDSTSATGTSTNAPTTRPQAEDVRTRAASAILVLYLLSPVPRSQPRQQDQPPSVFTPARLTNALQDYFRRAIIASLSSLSAALAALPRLERTLLEISARCQNIVALELLLSALKPPDHPLVASQAEQHHQVDKPIAPANLLQPLLHSLDTPSLPSYFWRTMASQLSARVTRILKEGGVSARTLKTNRERVRDGIRTCVGRGSRLPEGTAAVETAEGGEGGEKSGIVRGWEREAAVMVGSVINVIGR